MAGTIGDDGGTGTVSSGIRQLWRPASPQGRARAAPALGARRRLLSRHQEGLAGPLGPTRRQGIVPLATTTPRRRLQVRLLATPGIADDR